MNRRKAIITGAASGIGRATAIRFADEGYDLCLNDLNANELPLVMKQLRPGNHLLFTGSFADEQVIEKGRAMISENWKHVDALVNCAGLFQKTDLLKMPTPQWRQIFDIMINGCVLTSQLAVEFMHNSGRLIHITSIHGTHAEYGAGSYSMAKAAINQFCRAMAIDLADKNILVNAIAPGFVNTAMSIVDGQNELEGKWFQDNYIHSHHLPLKRAANPEEIASVALFLAGKDSSYITGQVLTVDGGLTITF